MNDEQDDPLTQDEQPNPLGYPTETPRQHHPIPFATKLQQPRPALVSQTQTTPKAPPAPPEPFTQADSIQLQRLQGGLATISQQVYSGQLDQAGGDELKAQVHAQLGPLMQRQQATKQQAQQQAKQQMMDASALQESIEQTHAVTQAEGFPQTVASFTDPVTGRTEHFYQSKRGDWKPLEFAVATGEEERQSEQFDNKPDSGFTAPPMTAAAAPEPEGQQPMTMDQFGAQMKGQTPSQAPSPQILNQFGEQQQPGQSTRGERDEWGRPTGAAGTDTFAEMYRRADRAIPRLGPNATPSERLHRQEQVSQLANRQVDRLSAAQEHREREKSLAAEHDRTEKARAAEHKRSEDAKSAEAQRKEAAKTAAEKKADQEKIDEHRLKRIDKHQADIDKENYEKDPKSGGLLYPHGGDLPEDKKYLLNGETRYAEAIRRADRERDHLHPPEPAKTASKPKEDDNAGLPPEVASMPSSVSPSQVHGMMDKVDRSLSVIPKEFQDKKDTPEGKLYTQLQGLRSTLSKAHASDRPLTVAERKKYEDVHAQTDALMKSQGMSKGAEHLRVGAQPAVAAPAAQPGTPPAAPTTASAAVNAAVNPLSQHLNMVSHLINTPAPHPESLTNSDLDLVHKFMRNNGENDRYGSPAVAEAIHLRSEANHRELTPREQRDYQAGLATAAQWYRRATYKEQK
jgi:hypothetical protein